MLLVALRGLQRRSRRALLGVLSIALIVTMFIVIQSISDSFVKGFFSHIYNTNADVWVSLQSGFSGMGGSFVEEDLVQRVAAIDGVERAEANIVSSSRAAFKGVKSEVTVVGYEPDGIYSDVELSQGRMPSAAGEAVIDEAVHARLRSLALGDTVRITGMDFEIVGFTRNRKMVSAAVVLVPIEQVRDLLDMTDGGSSFTLVTAEKGLSAGDLRDRIASALGDDYRAVTKAENIEEWARAMAYIQAVLSAISGVAFVIGALVMTIIVYISVVERMRELGVLKALGATNAAMRWLVVLEAVSIAVPGFVLGAALGSLVATLVPRVIPIEPELPAGLFAAAAAITVIVAFVGSIVGMRRAVKVDPVVALRTV